MIKYSILVSIFLFVFCLHPAAASSDASVKIFHLESEKPMVRLVYAGKEYVLGESVIKKNALLNAMFEDVQLGSDLANLAEEEDHYIPDGRIFGMTMRCSCLSNRKKEEEKIIEDTKNACQKECYAGGLLYAYPDHQAILDHEVKAAPEELNNSFRPCVEVEVHRFKGEIARFTDDDFLKLLKRVDYLDPCIEVKTACALDVLRRKLVCLGGLSCPNYIQTNDGLPDSEEDDYDDGEPRLLPSSAQVLVEAEKARCKKCHFPLLLEAISAYVHTVSFPDKVLPEFAAIAEISIESRAKYGRRLLVGERYGDFCLHAEGLSLNSLKGIESIDQLGLITHLYLQNNYLTALEYPHEGANRTCLEAMPNLRYLDVSDNRLTKISGLPLSLTYLNTSNNRLTSVPTIPPFLEHFIARNNAIAHCGSLMHRDIFHLAHIDLRGNYLISGDILAIMDAFPEAAERDAIHIFPQYSGSYICKRVGQVVANGALLTGLFFAWKHISKQL